eukprot:TRINITY_DN2510_c0_g1_i5.p1 TRINITY_DN2510_c0_g1~~TRINITY_DN2510_c0_g1_i5.p1  ORF type:complete len:230 (+),score=64.44 TRINITY_DN2510_c0_g1_i5:239-928(+)
MSANLDLSLDAIAQKAPRRGKGNRSGRQTSSQPYSRMRSDGGGRGNADKDCRACGEFGHIARECPYNDNGGFNNQECYNCGELGHISRECPDRDDGWRAGRGGGRGNGFMHDDRMGNNGADQGAECYNCGEVGHISRNCPQGRSSRDSKGSGGKGGRKGGKGGRKGGGKGKPANADDLEDDLDAYFGREGGKAERAAAKKEASKDDLDAGLDDYFGKKTEDEAPAATEE